MLNPVNREIARFLSGQTTDGQTDGRTDRQNQSLNPAAYARGNNKTGGNDGLGGELFKYGGKGIANLESFVWGSLDRGEHS